MCKITVNGYRMEDGTLIRFKDINIQNLPVHHIEELHRTSATAWDIVLLRNSIDEMKDAFYEENKKHIKGCPLNREGIAEIVREEIKKTPERAFKASSKFADMLTKLLVFILTIITIYNMLK